MLMAVTVWDDIRCHKLHSFVDPVYGKGDAVLPLLFYPV